MTQVPEVGSVWSRNGQDMCRVVYADELTVLVEWEGTSGRGMFTPGTFAAAFQPEPRKVTHRRWVNLYADGSAGLADTEGDARDQAEWAAKAYGNMVLVETRLIEWTVEEGGGE